MDAPKLSGKVSWTDYCSWTDDKRWEIIDGHPYAMTAPRVNHQAVLGELYVLLHTHFKSRPCQVFLSPIDVKISEYDVVQPDIVVICERSKLTETHVEGAPDLAIEVLSPSTQRHDRIRKLRLYAAAGVKEYWLIQPYPAMAEVLSLEGGSYRIAGTYTERDTLTSPLFPELILELAAVFPPPGEETIEEIRETPPPYSQISASAI